MSSNKPGALRRAGRKIGGAITWTRVVITNGIFFLLFVFILIMIFTGGQSPLPERAPLRLDITGFLVDQRSYIDPVAQFLTQGEGGAAETVVSDVVRAINAAATDPRVTELVLELGSFAGGDISKLEEIGQALDRFKDSDKKIIAVSGFYSQAQYYLASYADEIFMHPMGSVLLTGYGSYRNYFSDALEKLNINLHVFRAGNYKDAIEPFTRMSMSEESREHNSQWIDQLWSIYTSRVENQRQLPRDAINDYVTNLDQHLMTVNGDTAALAIQNNLVDQLATLPEIREMFIERYGYDERTDHYQAISFARYLQHLDRQPQRAGNAIGLIVASGTIYDGYQPAGNIGGDSLAALIREAREVRGVEALVLRIDSGGGSAFASELIRNELEATRAMGIPVLVSMGSVAASGGYWIAASADEIWATPATITGSIGVFSLFPTFEKTLQNLGISTDGYGTSPLADSTRLDMPLDPVAARVLQQNVDSIYDRFIDIVATGRGSTPEAIHGLAQGRVWSGVTAHEFGLVDELGYLEDVLAAAAQRIGAENYRVELIEYPMSPWQLFLSGFDGVRLLSGRSEMTGWWHQLAEQSQWRGLMELLRLVQTSKTPGTVYAHCVECVAPR